jgi:hypothetical protein
MHAAGNKHSRLRGRILIPQSGMSMKQLWEKFSVESSQFSVRMALQELTTEN